MKKRFVYVDNAATTKVSKICLDAMLPHFENEFGNPSSIYDLAHSAKFAIDSARKKAAKAIGADEEEIYFTSCGTESNNWAIKSAAKLMMKKGKNHLITSNFEHHSVLESFKFLEEEGFKVTRLPVNCDGLIEKEQLEQAITEKTGLVSIMSANNEIGTVLPTKELGLVCKNNGIIFHTDAVQAAGHLKIDVKKQNIAMLSISGHKIFAPKGIGLLYINKNLKLPNLLHGGGQEKGKRSGTENVAFIVALGTALEEATKNLEQNEKEVAILRNMLVEGILERVPKVRINGSLTKRLSGNANFSFEGIEGESILLLLNSYGICASSGSACTSNSLEPSHVLLALGLPAELAHGSLRISISKFNTKEEIEYLLEIIPKVVEKLRKMSPLWPG